MKPATTSSATATRVDLNLFRVFEVVYGERNLTRAAEILCLSPSAVSHALARLREQLKDPLFIRESNGVRPTPAAVRLWPDVQQALRTLRRAAALASGFDPARDVSQVTIAINGEGEAALLPHLMAAIGRVSAKAVLSSVRVQRSTMRDDLAAARVDCVIDVAQPVAIDVLQAPLASDAYVVVSRSPLAVTEATYRAARHVVVSHRSGHPVEDLALSRAGAERQIAARCQRYDTACRLVAQSDLLLTMPRHLAIPLNATLGNHISPVPIAMPTMELHLYWHQQRDADPLNAWLRECVKAALAQGRAPASDT